MTRTLGEILDTARKMTKPTEKTEYLRHHYTLGLGWFLMLAFSDVKWLLPEGTPPYQAGRATAGLTASHLVRELRRFYIFLDGGNPGLKQLRREMIFRDLLQTLDPTEVELLLSVKDKTFAKDFKCTEAFVRKTFPGLLESPFDIHFIKE